MPDDHHDGFLGSDEDDRYVLIKRLPNGNPCWTQPVSTLQQAWQRLKDLRAASAEDAGLYHIYDLRRHRDVEEDVLSLD